MNDDDSKILSFGIYLLLLGIFCYLMGYVLTCGLVLVGVISGPS